MFQEVLESLMSEMGGGSNPVAAHIHYHLENFNYTVLRKYTQFSLFMM